MGSFLVNGLSRIKGEINLAGDKSIAHRSVILSALAKDKTAIQNFPANADCLATINAFKKLGIKLTGKLKVGTSGTISIFGKGLWGLNKPKSPIFISDSGTTLRLLLGVLAGQDFKVKLLAGKSLSKRPMLRVTAPLRMMGAKIKSKVKSLPLSISEAQAGFRPDMKLLSGKKSKVEEFPPIGIQGGKLKPITYKMPVASAQVKSAILLAGLYTGGTTKIIEPIKTRDHTERMLKLFKANIKVKGNEILIKGDRELVSPREIYIPGDLSSASFFIVLASILPNSKILIRKVNLNPSRMGMVKVLKRMGADIQLSAVSCQLSAEPMGDILVKSSKLKGTVVKKEEIPSLIDELPVLIVAACCARGKSIFEAVGELRVKETDRINSMVDNLRKMGADIQVTKSPSQCASLPEGDHVTSKEHIVINGGAELKGARVKSYGDHRTAMSMFVAGLRAQGKTIIDDISCINKSFPDFLATLKNLTQKG